MSASGNTYSKTLSLSEGSHTWIVEAVDNVGNNATQNYSLTVTTGSTMETYLILIIIIVIIIIVDVVIALKKRRERHPPSPLPQSP